MRKPLTKSTKKFFRMAPKRESECSRHELNSTTLSEPGCLCENGDIDFLNKQRGVR